MSAIPLATWDDETKQMVGTYVLLNWNDKWEDANNPQSDKYGEYQVGAWCYYYFALNGEEVTVNYDTIIYECIIFKVERAEEHCGNSNYDAGRNFDIENVGYK